MKYALRAGLTAVAVILAPTAVMAHGNQDHAQPTPYDASKVEDTPFGREGDPKKAARTVQLEMADTMRYTPSEVTIRRGETVRFVISNKGKMLHEMVLGTVDALKEHAELMKKFPDMEHADPNMAHVKPGTRGQIVWQFTRPGEFQFACLLPGHYEAGMVGKVVVK